MSVNTTYAEIEQDICVYLINSTVNMHSYKIDWTEGTRYAPVAGVMSRNRFETLRSFIYINDNHKQTIHNPPLR